MENKAIDVEPKATTEMQSWTNIYDRVPSQYKQYVSYPTTAELADYSSITLNFSERQELSADSLAENWVYNSTTQRDIQLRYGSTILCNNRVIHQNVNDYTSGYTYKKSGQNYSLFEVLALDKGLLRVRPLSSNGTNMMRTCTVAVTAMGQTTYISFTECQSFIANNSYFNKLN